jgi:hypothetical protein
MAASTAALDDKACFGKIAAPFVLLDLALSMQTVVV